MADKVFMKALSLMHWLTMYKNVVAFLLSKICKRSMLSGANH